MNGNKPHATWWLAAALAAAPVLASAQSTVFFDDFSQCTPPAVAPLDRWTAVQAPAGRIRVNLFLQPNASCPNWTISNEAYLVTEHTGTTQRFPGNSASSQNTRAIWLNEAIPASGALGGSITRQASGLTIGRRYTVSVLTWTDDVDQPTGLRLGFGNMTRILPMQTNQNPQPLSATVCARTTSLPITLRQEGLSGSSPIVTHVQLTDDNAPCLFTVNYVSNGGTAVAAESVDDNSQATQPAPPSKTGQVFDGWYTDSALSTRYDFLTPVTDNITLYAKWVTGPSYTVSGSIVGLTAGNTVGLANTGNGDALPAASGSGFAFPTGMANAAPYAVTVSTQPVGQTCAVTANGSGSIANANVSNVVVSCTVNTYPLAGTVVGLPSGQTVVLANGSEQLPVSGASFAFATPLAHGSSYAVSVATQPAGHTCTVTQNTGTMTAPVNNVLVSCVANAYPLSGTVVGLAPGQTVVLANGSEQLPVSGASFAFATPLPHGSSYAVSVLTQPAGQTCTITQDTGTITAPVNNVLVSCANSAQAPEPTPVPAGTPAGWLLMGAALAGLGWRTRKRP